MTNNKWTYAADEGSRWSFLDGSRWSCAGNNWVTA